MPINVLLEIKDGRLKETINAFFRTLLDKKLIDALLLPLQLPSGNMVAPALVSDAQMLANANPLAPVMTVSMAKVVSDMTRLSPSKKKVGVILRPCEARALIELVKLKQASLENLILIGMDCFGTYPVTDYIEFTKQTASPETDFIKRAKEAAPLLREACRACEFPVPLNTDLVIGLIGMNENNILIEGKSPEGEQILRALGKVKSAETTQTAREKAVSGLIAGRKSYKDKLLSQARNECIGIDKLLAMFAPCIGCHNCRISCPICYCKECFFDSATFEWGAADYLGWSGKKGAVRMPTDSLLYHLTRLNHMAMSCVGCGLCQEGCPNHIPVFKLFRMVSEEVQRSFSYVPGHSLEDELPLSTFREDELKEVGI